MVQRGEINVSLDFGVRKNGLQLGAENNVIAPAMNIQRLDTHSVARQDQPFLSGGPQRDRKHAVEPPEALRVPSEEGLQYYFCIAAGREGVARVLQLVSQFRVIVDFPIEDNDCLAVFAEQWLLAGPQIDDLQAHGSQRYFRGFVGTLLIGTAVQERICSGADPGRINKTIAVRKTSYAAQICFVSVFGHRSHLSRLLAPGPLSYWNSITLRWLPGK